MPEIDQTLHNKLVDAVTAYDRKQESKRGYNRYALAQYLARVQEVSADIAKGADIRAAITAGFTGRLLDACLKAVGLPKSSDSEQRGRYVYTPVAQ
jgi:hypothetical protein